MKNSIDDVAVLLRRVDYGEAHVIVDLLTQAHGRVSLFARHARKSTRRFAGGLEPFTQMRVRYQPGREGALGSLQETESLRFFQGIVEEPLRLAAAAWLLSLIEGMTQAQQGGDPFFSYVLAIFDWLHQVASPQALACGMLRAEVVLLQDAGVLASMHACQQTGRSLDEMDAAIFRPGEGLVELSASRVGDQGVRLGAESLRLLEAVLSRRVVPTVTGAALHPLREGLFASWAGMLDHPPRTWSGWDQAIRAAIP